MRFLNTSTLHFEEVADSELHLDKNQYTILSHRWGPDDHEISYQDMTSASSAEIVSQKKGFAKIKGFCDLASSAGCRYGWVDTCCINKGNSSELAEAINSMYMWYSHSTICVVYLEDVPGKQLTDSEWFDRGWTLQELIAPKAVSFFDHDWKPIGTKTDLLADLSRKTRIPEDVLSHRIKPSACSVAQRMSWAATRKTKRAEDRAYSLLGLFDISMPMIYGEREKAFLRLQQQIVQKSKDESLFAWDMGPPDTTIPAYSSIFAPSPSAFIGCGEVIQVYGSKGFSESNGELSIQLSITQRSPGIIMALLNCRVEAHSRRHVYHKHVFIIISRTSHDTYVRVRDVKNISWGLAFRPYRHWTFRDQELQFPVDPQEPPETIFYGFWLRTLQPPGWDQSDISILSNCPADEADYICQLDSGQGNTGLVNFKLKGESKRYDRLKISWIKFGFDEDYNPVLWLANDSQSLRLRKPFERAVISRLPESQAQGEDEIMKGDIESRIVCGDDQRHFQCQDLEYDWPHGRAILQVDQETGLDDFVIHKLGVQISVQLQSYRSPIMRLTGGMSESGLSPKPMLVWVVDISSTAGIPELAPQESEFNWCDWLFIIMYYNCFPCLYPCFKARVHMLDREKRWAIYKREVESRSRTPVLDTSSEGWVPEPPLGPVRTISHIV
jgi:hypothetical protein